MKKYIFTALFTFLFATSQLFAQNGTVIEMKFSSAMGANGSVTSYFSSIGKKTDMTVSIPQLPEPMKMITITKMDNPEVLFTINETYRTYSEGPVKKDTENGNYTLENLGEEKILGYTCKHILVKSVNDGTITELWNTKEIVDYQNYKEAYNNNQRVNISKIEKSLIDAGVDGFPVKYIVKGKRDGDMTMELVTIEKKSIAKEVFDIPAGYTKTEGAPVGGSRMNGADQNSMTPEERAKRRQEMRDKQSGNR